MLPAIVLVPVALGVVVVEFVGGGVVGLLDDDGLGVGV